MNLDDLTQLLQAEPYDGKRCGYLFEGPGVPGLVGLVERRRVTCAGGGGDHGLQSYRTERGELLVLALVRAANKWLRDTDALRDRFMKFLGLK